MFDIGFSEMIVVAVVALVVIGPEKLPKVARTLGYLVGRMQRYVNDVKADINREMELEELRKLKDEFQRSAQDFEQTIHGELQQARSEVQAVADRLTPGSGSELQPPAAGGKEPEHDASASAGKAS